MKLFCSSFVHPRQLYKGKIIAKTESNEKTKLYKEKQLKSYQMLQMLISHQSRLERCSN